MDVFLRVRKESNKSRSGSYNVKNRVHWIISQITIQDCHVHISPTTVFEIAVFEMHAKHSTHERPSQLYVRNLSSFLFEVAQLYKCDDLSCAKTFTSVRRWAGNAVKTIRCRAKTTSQQLRNTKLKIKQDLFHYSLLFSVPVTKDPNATLPENGGNGSKMKERVSSNERIIYILSATAFILLMVLCVVLAISCYKRLHHKQEMRLFIVIIISASHERKNSSFGGRKTVNEKDKQQR